ncbi:lsg1 [Symbiodinium sp. CCMP2456]|nr:lsg1 [Symbiodinium sp. CCMP2456]
MALAGLDEELTRKIRSARPKPAPSARRGEAYLEGRGSGETHELRDAAAADALLVARVTSLAPLLHATRVAGKSIQAAAAGLLRSTRSIAADATFQKQLEDKDPPAASGTKAMIDAFQGIGQALADLAANLSNQVLAPLEALSNSLKEECVEERLRLLELDQQDLACSRAVAETLKQKERTSAELQTIARQENSRSWFRRPQARLEEMAAMETAVVEELASKMDQQAALKRSKDQCMEQFRRSLKQLDDRCASHLHVVADDFSRSLLGATEKIGQVAGAVAGMRDSPKRESDTLKPPKTLLATLTTVGEPGSPPARVATGMQQPALQPRDDRTDSELCELDSQAQAPQIEFAGTPSSRTGHTRESSTGSQVREGIAAKDNLPEFATAAFEASVEYASPSPKDTLKALPVEAEHPDSESDSHPWSLELHFDEHVKKLGFEIVWEAERPCVGSVVPGGEAERAGLVPGAVIMDMNGISTLGKSRDELMPLLKIRPLQLNAHIPGGQLVDSH